MLAVLISKIARIDYPKEWYTFWPISLISKTNLEWVFSYNYLIMLTWQSQLTLEPILIKKKKKDQRLVGTGSYALWDKNVVCSISLFVLLYLWIRGILYTTCILWVAPLCTFLKYTLIIYIYIWIPEYIITCTCMNFKINLKCLVLKTSVASGLSICFQ
jgi:hypothetical protein